MNIFSTKKPEEIKDKLLHILEHIHAFPLPGKYRADIRVMERDTSMGVKANFVELHLFEGRELISVMGEIDGTLNLYHVDQLPEEDAEEEGDSLDEFMASLDLEPRDVKRGKPYFVACAEIGSICDALYSLGWATEPRTPYLYQLEGEVLHAYYLPEAYKGREAEFAKQTKKTPYASYQMDSVRYEGNVYECGVEVTKKRVRWTRQDCQIWVYEKFEVEEEFDEWRDLRIRLRKLCSNVISTREFYGFLKEKKMKVVVGKDNQLQIQKSFGRITSCVSSLRVT